jgi:alkaline phosphatase D
VSGGGRISRRSFVTRSLVAGAGVAALGSPARGQQAPAIIAAPGARPTMPQGVACGDPGSGRAVIWSRSDRAARLVVEYDTTEAFTRARRVRGPAALASSDYTARVVLADLPPGQRIFYRVRFQDLADLSQWSEPVDGSFSTRPALGSNDVTIAWSADTAGQGWGLNLDFGGYRLYETMRRVEPDLFIHCGDTIYADQPLQAEVPLDDGTVWRNVVTPAKQKVAETLDEFRGNYHYNLLDAHMRRFNAEVGQTVIWDDHEVRDNWYETRDLSGDTRYQEKSVALLAARARQAFYEFNPLPLQGDDPERIHRVVSCGPLVDVFAIDLRSYRGPNSANLQPSLTDDARIFGDTQLEWLKARLAASRAVWKVIASDMPIGLVVPDGPGRFEAIANRHDGEPLGRELEVAALLRFLRDRAVRNVVWITGDVHYAAAHHYDPARARFTEFDPFWEFVAGPLNAGTFGPNALDATFGPEVRFTAIPDGMAPNRPPSAGLQFFGTLRVSARTRRLTAGLHDLSGRTLYQVELEPGS